MFGKGMSYGVHTFEKVINIVKFASHDSMDIAQCGMCLIENRATIIRFVSG